MDKSTGDELLTDDNDSLRRAIHILQKWKRATGKIDGEKKGETSQWEKSRALEI